MSNEPQEREQFRKYLLDLLGKVKLLEESAKIRTQVVEAMAKLNEQQKKVCSVPCFFWAAGF